MGHSASVIKKRHHAHAAEADEAENEDDGKDDEGDEGSEAGDDENEEENLEKFITTDADLQQRRKRQVEHHAHPHQDRHVSGAGRWSPGGIGVVDVKEYESSIFAPVGADNQEGKRKGKHRRRKRSKRCKEILAKLEFCCFPLVCIFGRIWQFLLFLNRKAANPVGHSENLLNGSIFVAVLGVMQHMLLIMFPISNEPLLREMYCCQHHIAYKLELVMFICNVLVLVAAYSVIWQTCGPFLFISPLYKIYLIFSMVARHSNFSFWSPDSTEEYRIWRTLEQILRLLFLMWEFCVVIAYTRQVRADRLARDTFIKARRRRLDFISRTRRHEDRKQFLRDPARQKTVLLLADPKRPWLKQTMAAKLAEQAFSENEAIASLWGPRRGGLSDDTDGSPDEDAAKGESGQETVKPTKSILTKATAPTEPRKKWFGLF